jgi:hypothetical protein
MVNFRGYVFDKAGNKLRAPLGLRRPCHSCDKMFYRDGRYQKFCRPCLDKAIAHKTKIPLRKYIN